MKIARSTTRNVAPPEVMRRAVLALLAAGFTRRETALLLGVTTQTVSYHVHQAQKGARPTNEEEEDGRDQT